GQESTAYLLKPPSPTLDYERVLKPKFIARSLSDRKEQFEWHQPDPLLLYSRTLGWEKSNPGGSGAVLKFTEPWTGVWDNSWGSRPYDAEILHGPRLVRTVAGGTQNEKNAYVYLQEHLQPASQADLDSFWQDKTYKQHMKENRLEF